MVGAPKSFHDLSRLQANLRVTCSSCGHSAVLQHEVVVQALRKRGLSLDWTRMPGNFRCAECKSKAVRLAMVPFASPKSREILGRPVPLALRILHRARDDVRRRRADMVNVRLALCVLQPYCQDQAPLLTYWEASSDGGEGRAGRLGGAFERIERQLHLGGHHPGDPEPDDDGEAA